MRTPITLLCAAALCLAPFAPVAAEPEPDNALWEATGPVLTDTIIGTLAPSDHDWYMLYVAADTQLTVTLQPGCTRPKVTLRDSDGQQLAELSGSATLPQSVTYPVVAANAQFLLHVTTYRTCADNTYTITLAPSNALLTGPPMPSATALGEPNEMPVQAVGPLAGDTWYAGDLLPTGDQDYYWFYADAPITVKAVNSGCEIWAELQKDLGEGQTDDGVDAAVGSQQFARLTHTPAAWERYYLLFYRGTNYPDQPTCAYRFQISPASAVKGGPRPLVPPTTKVKALKYKKVGKRVIVSWKPVVGAIGYDYRATWRGKYMGWGFLHRTQKSFKARLIPKKGMKVQVRARNDDGVGPKRTIRVTL